MIRKILKGCILSVFAISILLYLVPSPAANVEGTRLYIRQDDLIGTKPIFFALTGNGTLVGWGGDSGHMFRGIRDGFGSPYVMRKVLAKNVKDFACGIYNGMYIDEDSQLWGWGANAGLLFAERDVVYNDAVKIMEDVQSVAIGRDHAAAIKTDGTLWTWGRNLQGQLGIGTKGEKDGHIIDEGKYYEPQKIMENVQGIYILEDNITFAVAGNNELYVWGNGTICSPHKIAENIQTVDIAAIRRNGTTFQCLTTTGEIYLFDLYAEDFEAQFDKSTLYNAKSICRDGVIKEDDSLWKWEVSEDEHRLVEVEKNVACAAADFYLTDSGKLFVNSPMSVMPKPVATVVPYLRNGVILLCGALLIACKRNKEAV